ncbi:MAG TPA: 30S ribosomal protein S4 [Bryobacterales bacterium]|jgi:small subunit ribosomal protein S4|nr:30S ribosomal protein S4 [Bryobacterales bacterium]
MARYRGPVCRLCRREGMKLFLKGERCYSDKCAIEKRNFAPGQHGKSKRPKKLIGYGLQLREKQKVRRIYGLLERQFRNTFKKAAQMKGVTGDNLMSLLERRLDTVVYRMGLGTSRAQARQLVQHGHIHVNGRKVNIPSYEVKPGDTIEVRESSRKNAALLAAREVTSHVSKPSWIDVDLESLKGTINASPKREEMTQIPINEQLIVELYSK